MKNFPSPPPPPPEKEEEEVNGRRGSFLFFRAKYLRKICRWKKKKGGGTITGEGRENRGGGSFFSENSELLRKETGGEGEFPWGDGKEGRRNERRRRREKRLWVACNKFGPFSSTSLLVPFSPRSC